MLRSLENLQGPVSSIENLNELCQEENILKTYPITHLLKKASMIILIINNAISYYLFKILDLAQVCCKWGQAEAKKQHRTSNYKSNLSSGLTFLKFKFNVMTNSVKNTKATTHSVTKRFKPMCSLTETDDLCKSAHEYLWSHYTPKPLLGYSYIIEFSNHSVLKHLEKQLTKIITRMQSTARKWLWKNSLFNLKYLKPTYAHLIYSRWCTL